MKKELSKLYEPNKVEDKIYKYWLDGGFFHAEPDSKKEPYCIVIPPPNITGQLHMGHALDETLQDILIGWKRMSGSSLPWCSMKCPMPRSRRFQGFRRAISG
jgi:valyl-tRNA synthetase